MLESSRSSLGGPLGGSLGRPPGAAGKPQGRPRPKNAQKQPFFGYFPNGFEPSLISRFLSSETLGLLGRPPGSPLGGSLGGSLGRPPGGLLEGRWGGHLGGSPGRPLGASLRRPLGGSLGRPPEGVLEGPWGGLLGGPWGGLLGAYLGGAPEIKVTPPREGNGLVFGPGGRLQRGVPRLRTSEFLIPDLGDLEAMDLDTLEYHNLVAKNLSFNSLVAPQGGRRIPNFCF